jgi:hypothetical protein
MSTVVDDPVVDPPEVSDEEILSRCREIEVAPGDARRHPCD